MIKYEVIIYWSQEDECFVSEMPELPGCMADGRTPQEALANIEQIAKEKSSGTKSPLTLKAQV